MANVLARLFGIDSRSRQVASPWADRETLEAATWANLLDLPDDALPITRTQAMSVAAVARGRQLITGSIARLPLIGMRGTEVMDQQPPILDQPEAGRPRFQTLIWVIDAMLFYGRAWLTIQSRADERPTKVWWVPEWEAQIDELGNLTHAFGRAVARADVIRVDGPTEGLLNFAGPRIQAARRLDAAALRAASNPVPAVELHQTMGTPLTPDEARKLVADYLAARAGSDVSYTNSSIETKTHGASPEQLLIDGRKAAALDIARAMGLPAWAVDAPVEGSSMTYTNVPSRSRELIDYTLAPYMESLTARLSMDDVLPRGQWCRFDTDALLRDDFQTRMTSYKTALDTGVYTLDQLRDRERGIPLEK